MKKLLCALMLIALLAGSAAAGTHRVGILSELNMTEEEFQTYMDAALASGSWTIFSTVELEPVSFKFYNSLIALQMALNAGEIDEITLPAAVAEYLLNTTPGYAVSSISRTEPVRFAFGFRKSDGSALRDKFNDTLMSMKGDGTLVLLQSKYIAGSGVSEPKPVKFEKYNDVDTIKVAVTGDLPPIDFVAADGTPAGFNTAVIAEIGKRLHMNIELLDIEAGARAAALASGRSDVVFWFKVYTGDPQPDVPEGIVLSEPYYEWNEYLHICKK